MSRLLLQQVSLTPPQPYRAFLRTLRLSSGLPVCPSAAGPVFDATRISDPSVALADVSLSLPPPAARAPLSWAIFTPPKPFSKSTAQYAALRSWQNLRIPPRVYLVAADDLDRQEMAAVDKEFGTTTVRGKMNADGLLQVRRRVPAGTRALRSGGLHSNCPDERLLV